MGSENLSPMGESSKRLLGLRDFEVTSNEQQRELLGSDERLAAFQAIDTSTMPRSHKREMKRGVVLELLKKQILSSEILRGHPMVYIGSGTDIEYPLALGGRNIVMVDTIFTDPRAIKDAIEKAELLIRQKVQRDEENAIRFRFDFGEGEEKVFVQFDPRPYAPARTDESYAIPDGTGAIVLFASQGPTGVVKLDKLMKSKLTDGGVIIDEADVLKIKSNQEEAITLGKKFE